jgi:hypothetical protein
MSSNYFSGYLQESPQRFRRGREVISFEPGCGRALIQTPHGERLVEGMGAVNLRLMLEDCRLESEPLFPPDGGG